MKKLFSIIIISLLVWNTCIHPVAAATPSIVIDGGAVAGGGVAGGTNAKGDLAAVIAALAMASQGIKVQTVDGTPIDFIKDILRDYANFLGYSFDTLCNMWLTNVKILSNGVLDIGINNLTIAKDFLLYLKNGEKLYNPQESTKYVYVGGVACPVIGYNQIVDAYTDSNNDVYGYKNMKQTDYIIFWSDDFNPKTVYLVSKISPLEWQTTINGGNLGSNGNYGEQLSTNHLYLVRQTKSIAKSFLIPYVPDGYNAIRALSADFEVEEDSLDENQLIGNPSNVNPDDFDNNNIISPGIDLSALASAFGINGTVSISDYLEAITNAINGVSDNVIKVYDSVTGLYNDVPLTDYDVYNSTSVSYDNNVTDGQDIIDNNQLPSADQTEHYLKNMQFDLTGIFPFCIPFDIVNLLSKLDVSPVTPHVHLSFPNPVLDDPIVFDLDFSQWNGVAQVVRNAEMVAFVVGLAMVTRNLIRG